MLSALYKVLATMYYDSIEEINHGGEFTFFFLSGLQKMFKIICHLGTSGHPQFE